jgi:hypothetical protein
MRRKQASEGGTGRREVFGATVGACASRTRARLIGEDEDGWMRANDDVTREGTNDVNFSAVTNIALLC